MLLKATAVMVFTVCLVHRPTLVASQVRSLGVLQPGYTIQAPGRFRFGQVPRAFCGLAACSRQYLTAMEI